LRDIIATSYWIRTPLSGMARPLRILLPGIWFHVTARGNERRVIYENDRMIENLDLTPIAR